MTITIILALDVLITLLACGTMGPAAFKLGGIGLIGWAARAPFYLLRLYIGHALLLTLDLDSWYMTRPRLGATLTLTLALWSTVPGCPVAEKWLNLASGILQGLLLAYAAHRLRHASAHAERSR